MLNSYVPFDLFLAILELWEILWAEAALYVATDYSVEIIKSKVKYGKRDIKLQTHTTSRDACWAVQMPTTTVVFLNALWHVMKNYAGERTEVQG